MKYLPALGLLLVLLLWLALTSLGTISPLILPSPFAVGKTLLSLLFIKADLWRHIGLTSFRTIVSFALSCMIGIPLGLLMGFIPLIYKSLEFLVDFFRSIPPIALFPLFLLSLGIGELSKIGVPVYGCTLIIIVNSVYGVLNVPTLRRTVGRIYGFSQWQIFWKIVLPDSLPQVFIGMRMASSLALVLTVVIEMMLGSEAGLGKKIYDYELLFETPEMYVAIITTGAIGYTLNQGFICLERSLIHWADQ
jgi:ABC-type nitrate/sulfonate/bicarbonate transport system permease component